MPLTRRQIYRRRRIVVGGTAALLLAAGFYLPFTLAAPIPQVAAVDTSWAAPVVAAPQLDFPGYGAAAVGAMGYDGVLASSGSSDPLPIASITKIVTALVVLEAKPLALGEAGPDITFGSLDEQFYANQVAQDAVVGPAVAGQVISERNILDVMLMESANNYADSVANWAFGSEDAFTSAASAWLATQGLTATTITDPSGIEPSNVSTTGNLIELAKLAIANPVVSQIVSTPTLDVPGVGTVDNRNELLGIDGVDGIKTGTLDESGACLLFSAKETVGSTEISLVGVVLGGPDHPTVDTDVHALIDQATAGFHEIVLTTAGQEFASYSTKWGDTAAAVASTAESALVWAGAPVAVSVSTKPVGLGAAGDAAGTAVFTVGQETYSVALQLSATIDDPGAWWRLTNPGRLY